MGVLCAPWVTVDDLPEARPSLTDEVWERLCLVASERLYDLSGRMWRGSCTTTVTLDGIPGSDATPLRWSATGDLAGWARLADGGRSIQLPDHNVTEILTATAGDTTLDPTTYRVRGGRWLDRIGCAAWPTCTPLVLTYRFGHTPPASAVLAAAAYAVELGKAWGGDESCRLPTLVTSIVRQAVTINRLSAIDLRRERMIGIPEVDDWLTAVNPHRLRRPSAVWSPDTAPARTYRDTPITNP